MDELEPLQTILLNVLDKLSEITLSLSEISGKLDNLNGVYGLDDVIERLDEGVDKLVGPSGYNLTDLHQELSNISSGLADINITLITKD